MNRARDPYFASVGPDKIGTNIIQKVDPYWQTGLLAGMPGTGRGGMGYAQAKAWAYLYGFGTNGLHASVVGRGGDIGELALIRINLFRTLLTKLASMITGPKFEWQPQAKSWTAKDVEAVKIARNVCEHLWNNENVERFLALALEAALAQSEGYVHVEFDPTLGEIFLPGDGPGDQPLRTGALRYENLQTQDVIRDPMKPSWTSLDWVLCRTWRNKYDEAARWTSEAGRRGASPEDVATLRDRILDAPQMMFAGITPNVPYGNVGGRAWNPDDIEVWRFYHKPGAILPYGRDVRMLGDGYVLSFQDLDIGRFPLARITPGEVLNSPFGYTPAFDMLGISEVYDSLHSSNATNLTTFGVQSIAVEAGTKVDPESLGGMALYEYPKGGKPPQPLQLAASPPQLAATLADLKAQLQAIIGLDQVEIGERTSGSAIAIQDAQVLRQAGTLQTNYQNAAQDVGTISLRLLSRFATMPLTISLVGGGKSGMVRRMEITGEDLGDVDQVYIKMAPSSTNSEAGRQQMALTIAQAKPDDVTARDLIEIIQTGRLEPFTEGVEDEALNILRENELLGRGDATPVLISDQHVQHCTAHKTVAGDPAMRKVANVVNATWDHIREHYALYYGIKALAPGPMGPVEMSPTDPGFRRALNAAVMGDPLYGVRMMTLTGGTPPPPAPPGMPGSQMGPNPAVAPPIPAPAPGGEAPPEEGAAPPQPEALSNAPGAKSQAQQPTNPETGQKWNPHTGGDATVAARLS